MRHGRADYQRIQDPAANPALIEAYDAAMGVLAAYDIKNDNITKEEHQRIGVTSMNALSILCRQLTPVLADLVGKTVTHPIALDEPVFLLRASDCHAPDTIDHWATLAYRRGHGNSEQTNAAVAHADDMRRWQAHNGSKEPGT